MHHAEIYRADCFIGNWRKNEAWACVPASCARRELVQSRSWQAQVVPQTIRSGCQIKIIWTSAGTLAPGSAIDYDSQRRRAVG